jgi:nuclear protein localization family protein 4
MCEYCLPLEPYDPKYLEENKIKFMSYHSFLKLMMDKNKTQPISSPQFVPPLDEPSLRLRVPCPSGTHDPYPSGICTKCQPSAISLQSQTFRMVDHVEFESAALIDTFLSAWRQTGVQRFGYLFGRYEPYTEVPLGIKAVVVGVYEPSQEGWADGIQVDVNDPRLSSVDSLASSLGLQRVCLPSFETPQTQKKGSYGRTICRWE